MKRIASIFIALSLCTLPCFAETSSIPSAEINPTLANQNEQLKGKVATLKVKEIEKPEIKNIIKPILNSKDLLSAFCTKTQGKKTELGTVKCKKNAITITCNENKTENKTTFSNNKYDFSIICPDGDNKTSYSIEVVLAKKAQKKADEASQKTNCKKDGHGEWNDTLNKCNCNSGYVLDESPGTCVKETTAFKNAKEKLTALKSTLDDVVKEIEKKQPQEQ